MRPTLAIVIPTYNRAKILNELLHQLLGFVSHHDDVLVHVVADDSGDNTEEILDYYSVSYEFHSPKLGPIPSFRKCVRYAQDCKAKYCWLLGDDEELIDQEAFDELMKFLREFTQDLVVTLPEGLIPRLDLTNFRNFTAYVSEMLEHSPTTLLDQTIISGSIFDPVVFNLHTTTYDPDYGFVYGVMQGVRHWRNPVTIFPVAIYRTRTLRPLYSTWPVNMDKSLEEYLCWLSDELSPEEAKKIVKSWSYSMIKDLRNPIKFLIKHRNAIVSPGAWKFFFQRLLYRL